MSATKGLVIVTGTSTGIGKTTSTFLLEQGYSVVTTVRKKEDAEAWAKIPNAIPIILDVTKDADFKRAHGELKKYLDAAPVVHLINNAGIAVAGPVETVAIDKWQDQFDINVFGVIRATQTFLPWIRKTRGRIVNISSVSGRITSPFLGPYSGSKFALEAVSDALRRELKPFGVHVAVLEPGAIDTPIWAKNMFEEIGDFVDVNDEKVDAYKKGIQLIHNYFKQASKAAAPTQKVAQTIMKALEAPNPKTRYVIGDSVIKLLVALDDLLPDKWFDKVMGSIR